MTSARRGPAPGPITKALQGLVARGAVRRDPLQAAAALSLDRVLDELKTGNGGRTLLGTLAGRRRAVRGAYLVGAVGRGKTMLMDLMFAEVGIGAKRRVHFHEFMDEVHAQIADFRSSPRGRAESADPVAAVVKPMLRDVRLLCLDEFQVSDITNAMLLGRLFGRLWDGGVTIVATSNVMPDDLYRDGLNRDLVLPFIARLKEEVEVVPLDGPTDYRRQKFAGETVYAFGRGPEADAAMDALWVRLTGGAPDGPDEIRSLGRTIVVPHAAMGAARFDFADLCEAPLGARDYLRLAHAYDAVLIDRVPVFDRTNRNAQKRFILLVDTLYDRGVKLGASFAAPLDALDRDGRTAGEFARTVSRLMEMQSAEYLAAAHEGGAKASAGA
jgi:cell division protein ZapE